MNGLQQQMNALQQRMNANHLQVVNLLAQLQNEYVLAGILSIGTVANHICIRHPYVK